MSTFSGLSTALSSLHAQRRALDVAGQNVANAATTGYTRQRADLQAVGPGATHSLHSAARTVGDGVKVAAVVRLSDEFAMARLRGQEADASFLSSRAAVLNQIETRFGEPGDTGLTAQLSELWATWGDVANHPEDEAARGVMLEQAKAVADQIGAGYAGVDNQRKQVRAQTDALTTQVSTAASAVADLNRDIKAATAVGGQPNELLDERDRLVLELSRLTGATVRSKDDGTVDVLLSGTALVRGTVATQLHAVGEGGSTGQPVSFQWADGTPATVPGGRLAANKEALNKDLVSAENGYREVARVLADTVNALHQSGRGLDDPQTAAGRPFFQFDPQGPRLLSVLVTNPRDVAAGAGTDAAGQFDGSIADRISALGADPQGPNGVWESFVVSVGVDALSATRRSATAETVRRDAEAALTSSTSVDIDEEMVNMVTAQRAYEGAARMLTAVDQALDTLINRTGLVGR